MELITAARKRVKIRMNIASPSGFGKTYSSLLIAYGMTGDWEKIAVIDTENDSASLLYIPVMLTPRSGMLTPPAEKR